MFSNTSLPTHTLRPPKDDQATALEKLDNVSIIFYTLTIVLGITGNSMVIWVAGFKLKLTVTNVWLVNLAIADLIFCLTRVMSLIRIFLFGHWPFGLFLCKFNGFFKYTNMFCSVFLLAVISLDRMVCIWYPVFTKRRRTLWAAKVIAIFMWTAAVLLSIPYFIHRHVYMFKGNLTKCSVDPDKKEAMHSSTTVALYSIRFMCGFIIPFMVILVSYIVAGLGIRRTRLSGKSRPLRILACLVIAFFLCWAPYHCLQLVRMVDGENAVVKIWFPVAMCVAYFNSCVNPLLYFLMGLKVREGFRLSLMRIFRRALADDTCGQITQSTDHSVEPSSELKCSTL